MHLWPSMRIRDSFKIDYLRRLEWNLQKMNSEKKSPTNQQKLLDNEQNTVNDIKIQTPTSSNKVSNVALVLRDIFMVLSCCYCCFCCGACVDQEDNCCSLQ